MENVKIKHVKMNKLEKSRRKWAVVSVVPVILLVTVTTEDNMVFLDGAEQTMR